MQVHVDRIRWMRSVPVAEVTPTGGGPSFPLCLLHRTFLARYGIGVGTLVRISETGLVEAVIQSAGTVEGPSSEQLTEFDAWVAFRTRLSPHLPPRVLLTLFSSGISTYDILEQRKDLLLNIHGIGPATERRIRDILGSNLTTETNPAPISSLSEDVYDTIQFNAVD